MRREKKKTRPGRALRAFIPRRVSNRAVLAVLEGLRALHRLRARLRRSALPPWNDAPGAYLENQWAYDAVPFGRSSVRRAGCEAIAAYNALLALRGYAPPLETLIAELERDGMLLNGRWGASPQALRDLLRRQGIPAELTADPACFDTLAERSGAALLTFYNDRDDILRGIHTVCLTRTAAGYVAHNALFDRPSPPYESVSAMLCGLWCRRAGAICLTGVGAAADSISRPSSH